MPPFDASALLEPVGPPARLRELGEDAALLRQALYLEPFEPQILVLHRLWQRGASLRVEADEEVQEVPSAASAPDWVEQGLASPIHVSIWQEAYARLLLEEEHEGEPCLTLPPAHPYQGTLLRVVLALQLLYPDVLRPTRHSLVFRVARGGALGGCRHAHLCASVRALAFKIQQRGVQWKQGVVVYIIL